MKNCNTLFIGNRKMDTWPRVGFTAGTMLSTRTHQAPSQRSSHTCYVISEEPHFEQAADSCDEVAVVVNENLRNCEKTWQLAREKRSFVHGGESNAVNVLQDFISNRARSPPQHNLNISSDYPPEKSNINNYNSDPSKPFPAIPEQPERLSEESPLSHSRVNSQTIQQRESISEPCDNSQSSQWSRDDSELKSGSLVLIMQCHNNSSSDRVGSPEGLSPQTSRTSSAVQRIPVLVKIYQNCERYAIVTRTRRHQSTPLCIKLKKCSVVRSTTNPNHFVVMAGGHDGKSYRFEASSTQQAEEWMQAFSGDVTPRRYGSVQHETRQDSYPETLSRAVNENDDPLSPRGANPKKALTRKVHKIPLRPMPSLSESSDEDTSL